MNQPIYFDDVAVGDAIPPRGYGPLTIVDLHRALPSRPRPSQRSSEDECADSEETDADEREEQGAPCR